ncbi:hypothetical protein BKA56DRAFT_87414 [Ilyonectria sp. MPI-CAGE-AT-0026]|nr:hypothetical protein BKA56DRAFT_87414 [Ilyonectria sp. MPI-CAGE-AT-0026]
MTSPVLVCVGALLVVGLLAVGKGWAGWLKGWITWLDHLAGWITGWPHHVLELASRLPPVIHPYPHCPIVPLPRRPSPLRDAVLVAPYIG